MKATGRGQEGRWCTFDKSPGKTQTQRMCVSSKEKSQTRRAHMPEKKNSAEGKKWETDTEEKKAKEVHCGVTGRQKRIRRA